MGVTGMGKWRSHASVAAESKKHVAKVFLTPSYSSTAQRGNILLNNFLNKKCLNVYLSRHFCLLCEKDPDSAD